MWNGKYLIITLIPAELKTLKCGDTCNGSVNISGPKFLRYLNTVSPNDSLVVTVSTRHKPL